MDSPIQQTTERCSEGLGYGKLYECKPIPKICANEVLHAIDTGQSQAVVAKTFSVSVATIKRYLKRRREVEHVFPKAIPGRPAVKGAVLQAQLQAYPDATREEHCRLFHQAHRIKSAQPASAAPGQCWAGREKRR